jgi:hypothetical protein
MTHSRSGFGRRFALALVGASLLLGSLVPAAAGVGAVNQRYVVVFNGGYTGSGTYALGKGYALATQEVDYALDKTYALGRQYALYALNRAYALLDEYALTDEYALAKNYALYGQYALRSGYALARNYALGSGYALAKNTGSYALNASYALADDMAAYALRENYALLDAYALDKNFAMARDYALYLVTIAGGVVTADLTSQTGVMMVESTNRTFAQTMNSYALVKYVGTDFASKQFPSFAEAVGNGQLLVVRNNQVSRTGTDPLEPQQWSMRQIHTRQAHARGQAGRPAVRVGIVDSGIDGNHQDFVLNGKSNVDCKHGADFTFNGPGIGSPLACVDNNFHGTHVAGIVGARRNGIGIAGVAPNVTLVPIKVCDADGHCYVSDAIQGISYAGDLRLDVINMSFFVDDNDFQESEEFKCQDNNTQRAYREAIERALAYAQRRGVSLVAALGNSDVNLADPPGGKKCKVVPAQSPGVIGTVALGPRSEKADYSSWGQGWADVSAPGGNDLLAADCTTEVLSTIPGNQYGCFQGTSMASPHTTGVAALIISQFGKADSTGNWSLGITQVTNRLLSTVVDIGAKGRDKCFGFGRIDAFRAVTGNNTYVYDRTGPACTE